MAPASRFHSIRAYVDAGDARKPYVVGWKEGALVSCVRRYGTAQRRDRALEALTQGKAPPD